MSADCHGDDSRSAARGIHRQGRPGLALGAAAQFALSVRPGLGPFYGTCGGGFEQGQVVPAGPAGAMPQRDAALLGGGGALQPALAPAHRGETGFLPAARRPWSGSRAP